MTYVKSLQAPVSFFKLVASDVLFKLQNMTIPDNRLVYVTVVKASFWGLFRTNFTDQFRKLFLFTKIFFANLQGKVSLNILRSTCLEFCASNYFT